ncbi:MAG: AmmeMemoRadiSam system radical SAM enzyme [Acidobacteriota bacterium]
MRERGFSRREFLAAAAGLPLAALSPGAAEASLGRSVPAGGDDYWAELLARAPTAKFWVGLKGGGSGCGTCHEAPSEKKEFQHDSEYVRCELCARRCILAEGERGLCRARINVDGRLRSLVYGRPVAVHLDPIEKKPFYHFLPGSNAFSLSTTGCPLRCKFCQNWELSQARPEDYEVRFTPPEAIVEAGRRRKAPVIAFTYNEPTVFTEYLLDIAARARKERISSVLVSCGFMNPEPLDAMCDALQAIKIDLKGFSEGFYREVCGAELAPVLRTIRHVAGRKVHLEIVNLVVPTLNDSERMLRELARWVVNEVGPDVPVHFTRFHPDYRLRNLPPTPVKTLERAYAIAREEGLHYPFVGNVPGHPGNHTYCPNCGCRVIERQGFFVVRNRLKEGACPDCGTAIAGVWRSPLS